LDLDNAFESSQRKAVRRVVKGEGDAAAVRVPIVAMATLLAVKVEAVIVERRCETASRR
jgi:hypothetical protein